MMLNFLFASSRTLLLLAITSISSISSVSIVQAEDDRQLSFSGGHITMTYPEAWNAVPPANNIVEAELSIPPVEGDENAGRLTIMGAGGDIQANIDRWIGQFLLDDGRDAHSQSSVEEKEINGQPVHIVDVFGIYRDQRGPIAPVQMRDNYRMLGAIISTEERGQYFVKLVGPRSTIAENEDLFMELLDTLQVD